MVIKKMITKVFKSIECYIAAKVAIISIIRVWKVIRGWILGKIVFRRGDFLRNTLFFMDVIGVYVVSIKMNLNLVL